MRKKGIELATRRRNRPQKEQLRPKMPFWLEGVVSLFGVSPPVDFYSSGRSFFVLQSWPPLIGPVRED